jgi:hypothetical protein
MLAEFDYKGYRILANAVAEGHLWNCDVMLRRRFSQDNPRRELVMCLKTTPTLAEQAGLLWARFWIDLNTSASP